MLQFTNYNKQYNNNLIIQANLMLDKSSYWLKGENGSGKTTLFKSIAGLIPFNGEIEVDGISINKDRIAYRMAVNYAEAEPVFPSFLSGTDLIKLYTQTKNATEAQVNILIDALGIRSYMANKVGTYSSGMMKKLSLVLGFIGNPKLILLDEPLITLDHASVDNLIKLMEQQIDNGVMLIITSHQELTLNNHVSSKLVIIDKTLITA